MEEDSPRSKIIKKKIRIIGTKSYFYAFDKKLVGLLFPKKTLNVIQIFHEERTAPCPFFILSHNKVKNKVTTH